MTQRLSTYFQGLGAKKLSNVEINASISNQHEFNGVTQFRSFLGTVRKQFLGHFIYLNDDPDDTLNEEGILTWYDARENHPTRTEYRLYYSPNDIIKTASVGDLLIIGKIDTDKLMVIVAANGTTAEKQMRWLFNLNEDVNNFVVKDFISQDQELSFAAKQIIDTLGIDTQIAEPNYLDSILEKFGSEFPKTTEFSQFARESFGTEISPVTTPDMTLIMWLEREELLFKTLEEYIVQQRLANPFSTVDEFISYSLSVHNRRKSRAGHSFENHLSAIFDANDISYSKGKKTERNNKPDFLFPSITHYHDDTFNPNLLTMLGAKTSAKDRWRQILSEAKKISPKHLVTLQPAISINQTEEMRQQNLQLVIPSPIIITYTAEQQEHIIGLETFINLVKSNQSRI